ncbi:MAG: hypothetical protein JNL79_36775 [Myxococcales bacterium]|nr:hypothetical protein [Myxococcales bacterium]
MLSDQKCSEALAGTRCFYPCKGGNILWTVCKAYCRREDPNYYWCGYKTEKC